jgi:two-component system sensor histidine kinase GlrK
MLSKLSFRQLLLGVFLLIAVLLSAASLHALWTLDRLAAHSRDSGRHALALTEHTQQLAERSVAMSAARASTWCWTIPPSASATPTPGATPSCSLDAVAAALPYTPDALFEQWRGRASRPGISCKRRRVRAPARASRRWKACWRRCPA